jgi:tetratricopeptide (TPR) repeat protein
MTDPSEYQVFISYARSSSASCARAVRSALEETETPVFLDENDISLGDRFTEVLVDALLGARVIVMLLDQTYLTRWYCVWERQAALEPFRHQDTIATTTLAVVVALGDGMSSELDRLPPAVRQTSWPTMTDAHGVAKAVRQQLADGALPLTQRLMAAAGRHAVLELRNSLLEATALPDCLDLGKISRALGGSRQSKNQAFVGRSNELWRLDDLLAPIPGKPDAAPAAVALVGGGGLGKTQLAVEYLHRLGPKRFRGGLFWLDASQDLSGIVQRYHLILRTLDPQTPALSHFEGAEGYRDLLSRLLNAFRQLPLDHRALLVADNVPEPGPDAPPGPLESWFPLVGATAIILISRFDYSEVTRGLHRLPLGGLAAVPACRLLMQGYDGADKLGRDDWAEITEWLGGLPLVLELLNHLLRFSRDPAPILQWARTESSQTLAADRASDRLGRYLPAEERRGVTAVLGTAYDRLNDEERSAARLLACLAYLPIPDVVVAKLASLSYVSRDACGGLAWRSLLTPVSGHPDLPYTMHPVYADFFRGRSPEPAQDLCRVAEAITAALDDTAQASQEVVGYCALHGHYVLGLLARVATSSGRSAALTRVADSLGWALLTYYHNQERLWGVRTTVEQFTAHLGSLLGNASPTTLAAASHLSHVLAREGELARAEDLAAKTLAVWRRHHDTDDARMYAAQFDLAFVHHQQGRPDLARPLYENTLEAYWNAYQEEHPAVSLEMLLAVAHNLALTVALQGDLNTAIDIYQTILVRLRPAERHTRDRLDTADHLCRALLDQGSLRHAERLARRAAAISSRLPDAFRPLSLRLRATHARASRLLGDHRNAASELSFVLGEYRATGRGHHDEEVTRAAWELYLALHGLSAEPAQLSRLSTRYLDWLLTRRSETLTAGQQRVRQEYLAYQQPPG